MSRLPFVFSVFLLLFSSCATRYTVLKSEFVFDTAQVSFQQCHASTIQEIGTDSLLICWFAGTHEGSADVGIWQSNYAEGKYGRPKRIAPMVHGKGSNQPHWNPVLFQYPGDSVVQLYYKVGPNPREWWGLKSTSTDRGAHWQAGQKLDKGILGPIKNKPVVMQNGHILSPSSTESKTGDWKAHLEISEDQGKTWNIRPIRHSDSVQVIQPSILVHPDDRIQVLCRSKENYVMSSFSEDEGLTWSDWQRTNLQNPNSAADAIRLASGKFLIVYNPAFAGKDWWEGRTKLRLAESNDGLYWKDVIALEDGKEGDEYSYPTIIQDARGRIHITYTWNRKNIKHIVVK